VSTPELIVLESPEGVATAAAERFIRSVRDAVAARGRAIVGLAGGSTPAAMYDLLAAAPRREAVDWSSVEFRYGDERCVPPDDERSNHGLAWRRLLEPVGVRHGQVLRLEGELPPDEAAERAETALRERDATGAGRFDLLLLGLGADGHTASLFPGTPAVHVTDRSCVAQHVPAVDAWRLTLTPPVLTAARTIAMVVTGAGKAAALARVLSEVGDLDETPARIVREGSGERLVLADRAAAGG